MEGAIHHDEIIDANDINIRDKVILAPKNVDVISKIMKFYQK